MRCERYPSILPVDHTFSMMDKVKATRKLFTYFGVCKARTIDKNNNIFMRYVLREFATYYQKDDGTDILPSINMSTY